METIYKERLLVTACQSRSAGQEDRRKEFFLKCVNYFINVALFSVLGLGDANIWISLNQFNFVMYIYLLILVYLNIKL